MGWLGKGAGRYEKAVVIVCDLALTAASTHRSEWMVGGARRWSSVPPVKAMRQTVLIRPRPCVASGSRSLSS